MRGHLDMTFFGKATAMLAVMVVLSSCISTQFAYNQLDWYLANKADHYFDLSSEQEQFVDAEIVRLLDWHRESQLRDYVDLLTELKTRSHRPLTEHDFIWGEKEVSDLYFQVVEQSIAPMAILFGSLDDDQLDHFETVLADELEEQYEYLMYSPEKALRLREEETLDQFEHWYGDLTDAQRQLIAERVAAWPRSGEVFKQHKSKINRQLLAFLRNHSAQNEIDDYLRRLWLQPEQWYSEQYERELNAIKADTYELIRLVHGTVTEKQLVRLNDTLSRYNSDFVQLALAPEDSKAACRQSRGHRGASKHHQRRC